MPLITFADLAEMDKIEEHDFWSKRLKALRERRGEDMDGVPIFLQSKEASRLVRTARANAAMAGKSMSKSQAQAATRGQQGMAANAVSPERARRMRLDKHIQTPTRWHQDGSARVITSSPTTNRPGTITEALPKAPAVQKNDLGVFQRAQGQMWRQNMLNKLKEKLMGGLGVAGKAVNSPLGAGLGTTVGLYAGNQALGDPIGGLAGMIERSVGLDGTNPGPLGISDKAAAAPGFLQSGKTAAFGSNIRNRPRPTYNPLAPKPGASNVASHQLGTATNPIPLTNPLPGSPGNPVTANVVPPSSSPRPTPRTPPKVNPQGGGMNPLTAGMLGAAAVPAMGMGMLGAAGLAHYGIDALHSGKQKLLESLGIGGQGGGGQGGDIPGFLDPYHGLKRDERGLFSDADLELARQRRVQIQEMLKEQRAAHMSAYGMPNYSASSEPPLRNINHYFATPSPIQPTQPPPRGNL